MRNGVTCPGFEHRFIDTKPRLIPQNLHHPENFYCSAWQSPKMLECGILQQEKNYCYQSFVKPEIGTDIYINMKDLLHNILSEVYHAQNDGLWIEGRRDKTRTVNTTNRFIKIFVTYWKTHMQTHTNPSFFYICFGLFRVIKLEMHDLILCIGLKVSPQNSYVETLTLNVTVYTDRASKEAFKLKWGHKGEALIW